MPGLMESVISLDVGAQEPWPNDVKLYQPYPMEQILLPDNANCLATQAFLHMCGLPFEIEHRSNAEFMSPSGKVPFIKCGAFVVSELESIVQFVANKGISLSETLDSEQKSDLRAYMSLIFSVLMNAELYICWCDKRTYNEVTKVRNGSVYPWPLNHFQTWSKKSAVIKKLKLLGWYQKTLGSVYQEVENCCQALSERLEGKEFFFGSKPTELDAVIYGHVFAIVSNAVTFSKLFLIIQNFPNLIKHCKRTCSLCTQLTSIDFIRPKLQLIDVRKIEKENEEKTKSNNTGILSFMWNFIYNSFLDLLINYEILDDAPALETENYSYITSSESKKLEIKYKISEKSISYNSLNYYKSDSSFENVSSNAPNLMHFDISDKSDENIKSESNSYISKYVNISKSKTNYDKIIPVVSEKNNEKTLACESELQTSKIIDANIFDDTSLELINEETNLLLQSDYVEEEKPIETENKTKEISNKNNVDTNKNASDVIDNDLKMLPTIENESETKSCAERKPRVILKCRRLIQNKSFLLNSNLNSNKSKGIINYKSEDKYSSTNLNNKNSSQQLETLNYKDFINKGYKDTNLTLDKYRYLDNKINSNNAVTSKYSNHKYKIENKISKCIIDRKTSKSSVDSKYNFKKSEKLRNNLKQMETDENYISRSDKKTYYQIEHLNNLNISNNYTEILSPEKYIPNESNINILSKQSSDNDHFSLKLSESSYELNKIIENSNKYLKTNYNNEKQFNTYSSRKSFDNFYNIKNNKYSNDSIKKNINRANHSEKLIYSPDLFSGNILNTICNSKQYIDSVYASEKLIKSQNISEKVINNKTSKKSINSEKINSKYKSENYIDIINNLKKSEQSIFSTQNSVNKTKMSNKSLHLKYSQSSVEPKVISKKSMKSINSQHDYESHYSKQSVSLKCPEKFIKSRSKILNLFKDVTLKCETNVNVSKEEPKSLSKIEKSEKCFKYEDTIEISKTPTDSFKSTLSDINLIRQNSSIEVLVGNEFTSSSNEMLHTTTSSETIIPLSKFQNVSLSEVASP